MKHTRLLSLLLCATCVFAQSPITFQYIYDDLNQLGQVIDSTGVVLQYVYDPVGNILAINRSTIAPGVLTVFGITPLTALTGTTITIQGQGFNANPALNVVTIGGVAATVVSATATTLAVTVPAGTTGGPVTVTVGGSTATSPNPETVIPGPIITSVKPRVMQAGTTVSVTVTGTNLTDTTFSIPGAGIIVAGAAATPDGTSAALGLIANATANGRFAIVGTNGTASSTAGVTIANAFSAFVDPTLDPDGDGLPNGLELILGTDPFNADTDGDGFADGVEVVSGSNPLDPTCTPLNCRFSGTSTPVEFDATPFSALNSGNAAASMLESDAVPFSVLNSLTATSSMLESDTVPFSVLNMLTATSAQMESDSIPFSACNSSGTCTGYGPLSARSIAKSPVIGTPVHRVITAAPPIPRLLTPVVRTPVERKPVAILSPARERGAATAPRSAVTLAYPSPIDAASINSRNFTLSVGGKPLEAELRYSADFRTVALVAPVPTDTVIRVFVSGEVQDQWGSPLPAFESEFHTAAATGDAAAPVIAPRPPTGASAVDSGLSPIRLYMAKAIDSGATTGALLRVTQDGEPIAGSARVAEEGKIVEFVPDAPLRSGAVVRVSWRGTSDPNATPDSGYETLFTTAPAASEVAEPLIVVPGNAAGTALNPVIEIEYSHPLDTGTVSADTVTLREDSTSRVIRADIALRGERIVRITPVERLLPDSSYTYEVSGNVLDAAGQPATPVRQTLTTGTESNLGSPQLLSSTPSEAASDVEPTAEVRLSFDRVLNPLTLSPDKVWIVQGGVRLASSIMLARVGSEIILTPEAPLKAGSEVQITINGVEDLSGNPVPLSTIRFNVRAAAKVTIGRTRGETDASPVGLLALARRRVADVLSGSFLIGRR